MSSFGKKNEFKGCQAEKVVEGEGEKLEFIPHYSFRINYKLS